MMFLSKLLTLPLLALPLLSSTLATPVPGTESADLAARTPFGELEDRTLSFLLHDWRCGNSVLKKLCQLKGGDWACDKNCQCVYQPKQCDTYCPHRDSDKPACEAKGWSWSDEKCACTEVCPNSAAPKAKCAKDQGTWNVHKCCCEGEKCPDSEHKANTCKAQGGSWSDHECYCTPKPVCSNPTAKAKCDKDQGTWNKDTCTCSGEKCKDCDGKGNDCKSKGGSWDDSKCYCTPKPEPQHPGTCNNWWYTWLCQLKGKNCNSSCACY